jgi:hypothetical protein
MNQVRRTNLISCVLAALLLAFVVRMPIANAAEEPAATSDHVEERAVLEMDLERFYNLIQRDPDPTTKVTLLGHQKELAARANRLLEKFDSAKYEDLRYDINIQCQRLARKLAPLLVPPPSAKPESIPEIAVHELTPAPEDKAEVKAALDVVDLTIKRLENRLSRMTIGSPEYLNERGKIQRIVEIRAALGKEFTQARWDSLVRELKP